MPTVVMPLGLIVKTNDAAAIVAFQKLSSKYNLELDIAENIEKLMPLFLRYNSGSINESVFEARLLAFLTSKQHTNSLNDQVRLDVLLQTLTKEWKDCWNAMCQIDTNSLEILQCFDARPDIELVIYSDSNPTHIAFIARNLSLDAGTIHTTYAKQTTAPDLIKHLIDDSSDKESLKVLIGNPKHIKNETLRKHGEEKQQAILAVVPVQAAIIINGSCLTPAELMPIFALFPKQLSEAPKAKALLA